MIARLLPLVGTASLLAVLMLLGMQASKVYQTKLTHPEPAAPIDMPTEKSAPNLTAARPAVYYNAITQRPLFEPSRRPYVQKIEPPEPEPTPESVVKTPEPAPEKETPPPGVLLQGVIADKERNAALISVNGQEPSWVTQGQDIQGWTLNAIGNDWIEISRQARIIRVDMYK